MDAFAFPELSPQSESWLSRLMPEFSAEGAVSDMLGGSFDFGLGGVAEKLAELFFGEIGISLRTLHIFGRDTQSSVVLRARERRRRR